MKRFLVVAMIIAFALMFGVPAMTVEVKEEVKYPISIPLFGVPAMTVEVKEEVKYPISIEMASYNIGEAIKENPISFPDWWSMSIDIA